MSGPAHTCLAAIGDAESPDTWSGTPYHFLQAARADGYPIEGLRFDLARARSKAFRARWALGRLARLRGPRGLQYSDAFLSALWRTVAPPPPDSLLINCSQVFPEAILRGGYTLAFFLDQTLRQLFDYYEQGEIVPHDIQQDAIARERANYAAASAIVLQSRWAARSVIEDYGVDPAKVHVVIPGANIAPATLAAWDAAHPEPRLTHEGVLRLGFVGKDWRRKGLDRLLAALGLARAAGVAVELRVAGCDPATLPAPLRDAAGVQWAGFIDKRRAPGRMTEFLDGIDVGCLLSHKEAGGISLLEFARLGIPTLAPDTGGAPEYAVEGATSLIRPEASPAAIADILVALASDPSRFAEQRRIAWEARHWADWRRSAREMRAVLAPEVSA